VATTTSAQRIWEAALGRLQVQLTRPTFDTWLRDTRGLSLDEGNLRVGVPTTFAAEWLEHRMYQLVEAAAAAAAQQSLTVAFEVQGPFAADDGQPATIPSPAPAIREEQPSADPGNGLNPRYTFDSFIVSATSQLAHAAALAVSDHPGSAYNPLFIHAGVGLGKTHLLHAIADRVRKQGKAAHYVSSEQFTNDFISSIQERKTREFQKRHRSVDVLLIDDIQFLSGKQGTQEGFFHTFNALHTASRQVIIAGDRPPSELAFLEERLRSRFEGGLITDIQAPDLETRTAIIRHRAQESPVPVPDQVLDFVAQHSTTNVRKLEGNLNRVTAMAHFTGQPVTLALAEAILGPCSSPPPPSPLSSTPQEALEAVAVHYQVERARLVSRHRDKRTAAARQVAMFLLAQDFHLTPEEVGHILGDRDRTTVIYSVRKVQQQCESNPALQADLGLLRRRLTHPAR